MRRAEIRQRRRAARVAAAMLAVPEQRCGLVELGRVTGVRTRRLSALLTDWLDLQWLEDGWTESQIGVKPRRWYRVTDTGTARLAEHIAAGLR